MYHEDHEAPVQQHVPEKKKHGCFFWGCTITSIILLLIAGSVGYGMYQFYSIIKSFTSDSPAPIATVNATQDDYQQLANRVAAFTQEAKENRPAELILSENDINTLIALDPSWQELKGRVFVKMAGDTIQADASIPLDLVPGFKGRYLNGTIGVKASLQGGVLLVTPETVVVNGRALPEEIMAQLRNMNLAQNMYKDKEKIEKIQQFEALEVKDGKLVIRRK